MGPLTDQASVQRFLGMLDKARALGGSVHGGVKLDRPGNFVTPAIVTGVSNDSEVVQTETFARFCT